MTDHEIALWSMALTAAFGVVGIASAVYAKLAVNYARRQLDFQKRSAEAEGIFERANLRCELMSTSLIQDDIVITYFGEDGRIAEMEIPLLLENDGSGEAENVTVYVRVPKALAYNNNLEAMPPKGDWPRMRKLETGIINEENFCTHMVSIPRLRTHERMILRLPISVPPTGSQIVQEITSETADNIPVNIRYRLYLGFIINIVAVCDRAKPYTRKHSMMFLDVSKSSLKDLIKEMNKPAQRKRENSEGLLARIKTFLWPTREVRKLISFIEVPRENISRDPKLPINHIGLENAPGFYGYRSQETGNYMIPHLGIFDVRP